MSSKMISKENFICLAEDWGAHPTSTQHLLKQFMDKNAVLWVNSISMRSPALQTGDLKRLLRKLQSFCSQPQDQFQPNLKVISPLALPFYQVPAVRRMNRIFLRKQLKSRKPEKPILWVSLPTAVDLVGEMDEKLSVYYCGDEFSEMPGVDPVMIRKMEAELLRKADLVLCSSESLVSSKRRMNSETYLIPHGVDFSHFQPESGGGINHELRSIKTPIVGFFGHIAPWVDVELIAFLAQNRPQYSFVLIGQVFTDTAVLHGLSNVFMLGQKPYAALPEYVTAFDAAMIPFRVNELTRNVNPLKLLEYFAAGKPVVSTPTDEVERFAGLLRISRDRDDFLRQLDDIIGFYPKEMVAAARRRSKSESWEQRAEQISCILEKKLKDKIK